MKPSTSFSAVLLMAERMSWYAALLLALMLLVISLCKNGEDTGELLYSSVAQVQSWNDGVMKNKPCDEIYVVGEGETLNSISDKCGDPYIVEENPHVHDPDDVFPGLVIKITPFTFR